MTPRFAQSAARNARDLADVGRPARRSIAGWIVLAMLAAMFALGFAPATARAQDEPAAPADGESAPVNDADLARQQREIAQKFQRLEEVMVRMAELTGPTDPKRAALLRKAVAQSKDKLIGLQLDRLVELLQQDRLSMAITNQNDVNQDLAALLELLLTEERDRGLKDEQQRIKEHIRKIREIINQERQLQGENAAGRDTQRVAEGQGRVGEATGRLAEEMKRPGSEGQGEGKPGEGEPGEGEPGEGRPGEGRPGEGKPGEGKPGEGQPGEGEPGEGKPGEGKPGEGEPGEGKPGEGEPGEGEPGEGKPGEGEPGEGEPGEGKPGEGQPGEGEPGEGEPGEGEPGEGQPGEGQPGEGQPGEGQPGEGQPGEGQPGEGQPGEGQPGEGQPGEGQPGEGQPGEGQGQPQDQTESARQRVKAAQQRMEDARKKLEAAQRKGAGEEMERAIAELERAKAELEEILRQMREEELQRMLAMLEARFRKMLEMQLQVYEGTKRLDRIPEADRGRSDEIEAGRLSRRESQIVIEADSALAILREEGSAVAFPEAVSQMREDMEQVVLRLSQVDVGELTQGIEEDIIAALEEMIEALQKAQEDLEQQQQQGQPPPEGEPQDPPLIDTLAELKMIRSLQMRINNRTKRFSRFVDGDVGQTDKPELVEQLKRLSERELDLYRVTRDIVTGRNQ